MASRPGSFTPAWPDPTPHFVRPRKRKWNAADQPSRRLPRQAPVATVNSDSCGPLPDNNQFTCYPLANSTVIQGIPTRLVWNTGVPIFAQTNVIDVYLYHGDTDELVSVWKNRQYTQGHLAVTPNDTWWGTKGREFTPGKNSTQSFFFIMVVNGTDPIKVGVPQTTFTATQTNFPDSILASQTAAALASSASLTSLASLTSTAASSTAAVASAPSTLATGNGNLQGPSSDQVFPHWAIALLAVFGFLALVAFVAVFWLLIRHLRRRRRRELAKSHRHSLGSDSPMMADIGGSTGHGNGAQSPTTAESGLGPLPTIPVGGLMGRQNVQSDGASTISRADSAGGPFSQTDAAAMAAAFRNVMRKPDFANQPMEEGDSPGQEQGPEGGEEDEEAKRLEHEVLMGRELAEEGRDIRSVSSSRGVRVETLSDGGRTGD